MRFTYNRKPLRLDLFFLYMSIRAINPIQFGVANVNSVLIRPNRLEHNRNVLNQHFDFAVQTKLLYR